MSRSVRRSVVPAFVGVASVLILSVTFYAFARSGGADRRDRGTSSEPTSGVRRIAGFPERSKPAATVVENGRLFLFGGEKLGNHSNDKPVSFFRDAAIVDPATGKTELPPEAPFDDPLAFPVAVHVDGHVVVMGERCNADEPPEGSAYFCEPYTYAAARYNVREKSWTQIDLPAPISEVRNGYIVGLGASGGEALFLLGSRTEVWSYSVDKDEWRRLADGGDTPASTCVAGGRVVSVTTTFEKDGVVTETNPQSVESGPGVEYSIAPSDGWVGPTVTATDVRTGVTKISSQSPAVKYSPWSPPSVTCVGDIAVVLPNGLGALRPLLYNMTADTWVEAAPAPVTYVQPARVSTGTGTCQ